MHTDEYPHRGFTPIEILVVIGMVGVLAAAVLVAVNPPHQFAQARNAQRMSDVNAILDAVYARMADHQGVYSDGSCGPALQSASLDIANTGSGIDLWQCLVPTYIAALPHDPAAGSNDCTRDDCAGRIYDAQYTIAISGSSRVTVCAPHSTDDGMRAPYCLTR